MTNHYLAVIEATIKKNLNSDWRKVSRDSIHQCRCTDDSGLTGLLKDVDSHTLMMTSELTIRPVLSDNQPSFVLFHSATTCLLRQLHLFRSLSSHRSSRTLSMNIQRLRVISLPFARSLHVFCLFLLVECHNSLGHECPFSNIWQ